MTKKRGEKKLNGIEEPKKSGWLQGWKEIAGYMGCSVKTAQDRKERLGLPLHKLPGPGGKYEIYIAIPSHLDRWLKKYET
jgi:hypothetical protein